jgi:putative ABC transport system ATP-binding protein
MEPARTSSDPVVRLTRATKTYSTPAGAFHALRAIDLEVGRGEFLGVVGRSGSGKSTLLNLVAGIDRPTSGTVEVAGTSLGGLSEARLSAWRGAHVGVVFQFFELLPTLTAAENVMLPMEFAGRHTPRERRQQALALLERMDVCDQADKLPGTLSGGQRQRVAIARSLANQPALLVADEPTGNLDTQSSESVLALLTELAGEGRTVIMVTHEPVIAGVADRVVTLVDGALAHG